MFTFVVRHDFKGIQGKTLHRVDGGGLRHFEVTGETVSNNGKGSNTMDEDKVLVRRMTVKFT